jgi:hypothetical protein
MRLWLQIQIHSADSKAEVLALLKKPEFDALKHLSDGHVSVFKEIMDLLEKHEVWDEVYRISQHVFEKGIEFMAERKEAETSKEKPKKLSDLDKTGEVEKKAKPGAGKAMKGTTATRADELAEAKKEAEARAFCSAVMDWALWNQFIRSASHHAEDKK